MAGWKHVFYHQGKPDIQNYITIRFWESDVSHDRLYFVCGDKKLSSRHAFYLCEERNGLRCKMGSEDGLNLVISYQLLVSRRNDEL